MTWIGGALTQWSGTAEPGWNGEALSHTRAPRNSGTTEYANLGPLQEPTGRSRARTGLTRQKLWSASITPSMPAPPQ